MPFINKKHPQAPTLGLFVPCDPRLDEESRRRAFNIGRMTARLLADRLRLPDGRALTGFTHEYKRHGTTTLFAALEVATGLAHTGHYSRRRRR